MRSGLYWTSILALLISVPLSPWNALAQRDTTPKKRLRSPATVHGFIGGESHDSYVIYARKGQVLEVRLAWKREAGTQTSFTISQSANFFNSEPVRFGEDSHQGRRWRGIIPETGNYYLYVLAHPTARYTLRAALTSTRQKTARRSGS